MKKTFSKLPYDPNRKVIIATVGLADPTDPKNIENIRNSLQKQLPKEIYEQASLFHLRGGIDYSRHGFKHKTMMGLMYKKAVSLPEEKKNAEVKAMIETYNQKVDFVDLNALDPILEVL